MKILVEKTVIEQALEALESYSKSDYIKKQHPKRRANGEKAITTLREALDPELQFVRDWNEGNVRRVSDGKVMGFAEQAEQEPVVKYYGEKLVKGSKVFALLDRDLAPDTLLYTAPVRTKDLTDDEISVVFLNSREPLNEWSFARAVITADREKNK